MKCHALDGMHRIRRVMSDSRELHRHRDDHGAQEPKEYRYPRDASTERHAPWRIANLLQQHSRPSHDSFASRVISAAMTKAAAGSAHHHPSVAFSPMPARVAIESHQHAAV